MSSDRSSESQSAGNQIRKKNTRVRAESPEEEINLIKRQKTEMEDIKRFIREENAKMKADITEQLKPLTEFVLTQNTMKNELERVKRTLNSKNIVITGCTEADNETDENRMEIITKMFEHMEVGAVLLGDVYRIGIKKPNKHPPLLVKFVTMIDKKKVMKNRGKLRGSNAYLDDDLTKTEQEIQKILIAKGKELKATNKEIKLSVRFGKLYIDNNGTKQKYNVKDGSVQLLCRFGWPSHLTRTNIFNDLTSIIYWNCEGIFNKTIEFFTYLLNLNASIFALSETWHTTSYKNPIFENYEIIEEFGIKNHVNGRAKGGFFIGIKTSVMRHIKRIKKCQYAISLVLQTNF